MHPKVEAAFQEIDAALFSSDTFDEPEARARLKMFLDRWSTKVEDVGSGAGVTERCSFCKSEDCSCSEFDVHPDIGSR